MPYRLLRTAFACATLVLASPLHALPVPVARATPGPDADAHPQRLETAVFAGGCFWGVEAVFEHVVGVRSATSGYAGGTTRRPSYEEVSTGTTGHAESVRVVFDPAQVTYEQLLAVFFTVAHDPTQLDRQGPDHGSQYRSVVFYDGGAQQRAAEAFIARLGRSGAYDRPIVTEVAPLRAFYPAEDYHQDYVAHHPHQSYIVRNDAPKVAALRRRFPTLYRD